MKKITVVVEFAKGNLSAYIKEVDGITAAAQTMQELKRSINESIQIYKEECEECEVDLPEALKGEYEVVYKYDTSTFLSVYSHILSKAGLERLSGINQKQLWHYANGKSTPRPATISKFQESIHTFARELEAVELC